MLCWFIQSTHLLLTIACPMSNRFALVLKGILSGSLLGCYTQLCLDTHATAVLGSLPREHIINITTTTTMMPRVPIWNVFDFHLV